MRLFRGLIALAVAADAAREMGGAEGGREVKNIAIIGKSDQ